MSKGEEIAGEQPLQVLARGVFMARPTNDISVGCVFTGAASAYAGMGRELGTTFPDYLERTLVRHPVLQGTLDWLDPTSVQPTTAFSVLQGCSLLSQFHASLTNDFLGIPLDAMLGVSSGETNSLFAAGVWRDMGSLFEAIDRSEMYSVWISGEFKAAQESWPEKAVKSWRALRVVAPIEQIRTVVESVPYVDITMINTANDCIVAGERGAVEQVRPALERVAKAVLPLGHDIIAHSPALRSWRQCWYRLHDRPTEPRDDLRFYASAFAGAYEISRESCAQALTSKPYTRWDFRPVVESAYRDGVRVFIEQGPRSACSEWIGEILGDRPHLCVAFDAPGAGVQPFVEAVAKLWCVGVSINPHALRRLELSSNELAQSSSYRSFPAHPPKIELPKVPVSNTPQGVRSAAAIVPLGRCHGRHL